MEIECLHTWPKRGGRLISNPWILNFVPQILEVISTIRPCGAMDVEETGGDDDTTSSGRVFR